jgi:glyoxylase-like metal-dependent hydrolase (beta-lactamase superfamily II)
MAVIVEGISYIDVEFVGVTGVIASAVIEGPEGIAIVDPGPTTSLAALRAGLRGLGYGIADIRAILLTHIHLDHAGATGTLVREQPGLRVYVHERGAKHMADPRRLLDSATRLYGEAGMAHLWGEFLPVAEPNMQALAGGEQLEVCGRRIDVAYTPGHASHHVSFLDQASGIAFVGDVAGGRLGDSDFVMTPTPPPDIDLAAWQASMARILAWRPTTLFLTHFGPSPLAPAAHLGQLSERLPIVAAIAREAMARGATDEACMELFRDEMRRELRRHMSESSAAGYELAMPFDHCFAGLQRYWQKQS